MEEDNSLAWVTLAVISIYGMATMVSCMRTTEVERRILRVERSLEVTEAHE